MDEHSLRVLELPAVLEKLASHAATPMGREAALHLRPSGNSEVVLRRLQETREARHIRDHTAGMPLGGLRDIRDVVARAVREQQLTPHELNDVARTAEAATRLRAFLIRQAEVCPLLAEMAGNMPVPAGLDQRISACIAENAEIRDNASPELERIRSERKQTHGRLLDRLNRLLATERVRSMLQEPLVTEREGRYCLPVRSEYRSQFGGIVHDVSTSGATVFMEPGPCVELGNRLKELDVREQQEVSRILTRLTALVAKHGADLQAMQSVAAALDVAHAKAVLAEEMGASEPQVGAPGTLRLYSARHPLLAGEVVPIDVEIGHRFDVLLLTGPNTGGKTVALKTVGLLALMRQCGLQVPASPESEMALFDGVYADIGDEQDIQQSLSTFSAHMRNIVRIVEEATSSSLVLLDEIGAGTDPSEGAALAKAILETLQERGARVIATTHYGELKEFAYTRDRVENAAVEFDRETLRPTYRVLIGIPGSSHAFYIAQRLGLPEAVVEQARAHIGARERDMGDVIERMERSRTRAAELERQAEAARKAAEAVKTEYEQRVREIAEIRRTVRREVYEEARAVLRRASDRAENIIAELRKMNKGTRRGPSARKQLAELRQEVARELEEPDREPLPPLPEGHVFHKGDRVYVATLDAHGSLLDEPDGSTVQVQIGALRATLPTEVLRPATQPPPAPTRQHRSAVASIAMQKAMQVGSEVMIRAMRVEEAHALLDRYLDDAYGAGLREVRIIHGKGTGVLRRFVHDFLRDHPLVRAYRLADEGEGGAGVTIAEFKE